MVEDQEPVRQAMTTIIKLIASLTVDGKVPLAYLHRKIWKDKKKCIIFQIKSFARNFINKNRFAICFIRVEQKESTERTVFFLNKFIPSSFLLCPSDLVLNIGLGRKFFKSQGKGSGRNSGKIWKCKIHL